MGNDSIILLPLGYHTSLKLLRKYGYYLDFQTANWSVVTDETSEGEIVDEAAAIFFALYQTDSEHVD
jgi:hypothetical protein